MYGIKIIAQAQKDIDAFGGKTFEKIKNKIEDLNSNPRPFGAIKLTQENGYRIRMGDYRILYRIDDKSKEVIVYRVKHRKEVYR
jgi:mRNA interferase RelE/StbE